MKIAAQSIDPAQENPCCAVVGVYAKEPLGAAAQHFDRLTEGLLSRLAENNELRGKPGKSWILHYPSGGATKRLLLIHCGQAGQLSPRDYRKIHHVAARQWGSCQQVDSYLLEAAPKGYSEQSALRQAILASSDALYHYHPKGQKKQTPAPQPKQLRFHCQNSLEPALSKTLNEGQAIGKGRDVARQLGNLPPNVCNPGYLAEQARQLAVKYPKIAVDVLTEKELEDLGCGALLAVASGSRGECPPCMIVLRHQTVADQDPIVLVGKGVTFDSGGISIKPSPAMDEMKFDMCGAASVFGCMVACAELQLQQNVIGIIPATENMPSRSACRPGDVVTSMSGQTIEILNTDAEGRLILCDALHYAKRFKPTAVIDIATLTGACIVALGHHPSAVLGNDETLISALRDAGEQSGDRCWPLPLWEEYQDGLKSRFADIANISSGRGAGTITAACFLSRFTQDYRWAHLDIAGTAWLSNQNKGATGRPVSLLMHYLLQQADG